MTLPASFLVEDADVPSLRQAVSHIARLGYSEKGVRECLGLDDLTDLQWRALPAYRAERLAARDSLALAIDLFLLQAELPASEHCRLFDPFDRDVLSRAGVLEIDGEGVARARASLFPVGERLVFSDHMWPELPHPGLSTVPYNQVMFVGPDSRHLARCTSRRPVRAALDLCTGSGIQALLAAAHAERVVAVDVSPRAADCVRFNARALGIGNLEVAVGDLFAPVDGEQFDLITANPPFVPSPVDAVRFRDGGRSGEDIQKRIVAGLPRHLAPGGIAHIVTELGERDQEPLADRFREWLDGAPIDIHLLRLGGHSATKYAIGHAKGDTYADFLSSVGDWAGNLRAQGFVRVVPLLVSFEWSDPAAGPPWQRTEQPPPPTRAAGSEIEATFLAERLARKSDLGQILRCGRLRLAGPVALFEASLLGGSAPAKTRATRLGQALAIEHELDPIEREVLGCLSSPVALSELLTVLASREIGEESAISAARSLLRKRLISVDG